MRQSISTNSISHKVLETLKGKGFGNLTLRPWNQFKPEDTLWWLVPSRKWPAYKYGKIAIFKTEKSEDFRVGYHFEKGVSELAGQMLPTRTAEKLCIRPDWIWHTIIADIKNGRLKGRLDEITVSINRPIKLIIQASAIKDKESQVNSFEGLELNNIIEFEYDGSNLECSKDIINGEMRSYAKINTIEGLLEIFESKDMEWFWIDFYIIAEILNSEHESMEKIVPVFIGKYEELF